MCFQNVLNFVVKFSHYGSVYFFKLQIPHISLPYNIRGHPLSVYAKFSEKLTNFAYVLDEWPLDMILQKIQNFELNFLAKNIFVWLCSVFFALRISGLRHSSNVFEPCWDVFNIDCSEEFVSWEILFEKYLNLYLFSIQHVLPVNCGREDLMRCVP